MNLQVSVIIVNYKVRYFLEQCVLSVQAALRGVPGEIIVIDNVSEDGSCEMIKQNFPEVILIENKENVGFSKANNQGVEKATGKYVFILNPDTVIGEDSISKLIEFAENKENLGMIGGKLVDGTGNFLPESKRGVPTPTVSLEKMFGFSSPDRGKYYATRLSEDETGKIDILVGAFMFLERQKYIEVGGFDEDYFMYGEDIDLSYKIRQKKYDNYYYPKVQIIHYKGESTSKDIKYLNHFYGAMDIFYKKHFKVNFLFDIAMKSGIKLWYLLKYFQIKKKSPTKIIPKNLLYIGSENAVYEALRKHFPKTEVHLFAVCETRVISRYEDLEKIENILSEKNIDSIVFDNQSNSFGKIIFYITSLKNKGLTFKIRPKNTSYIIGSNTADSKGEVINLTSGY